MVTQDEVSRWRPILPDEDAARAQDAVAAILQHVEQELLAPNPFEGRWSVINGLAGTSLLYHQASVCGIRVPRDSAVSLIERAIALVQEPGDQSFYFGLSGLVWAGEVVGAWQLLGADIVNDFDVQLCALLRDDAVPWSHGLFRGLAGVGVYALRRLPASGPALAALVVDRLRRSVVRTSNGVAWLTDGDVMRSPTGGGAWFSMGIPHGTLAPVGFLAAAAQHDVPGAADLLYDAGRWLHAQRMSDSPGQCFPISIDAGARTSSQRLAWCNGDLPCALTLWNAGDAIDQAAWRTMASEVASLAATLTPSVSAECSLCHGDAGIAFVFSYLHARTGAVECYDAAISWYRRALSRRMPGAPYEGYRTLLEAEWSPGGGGTPRWTASGQFLRGAGGIALALLSATAAARPEWAEALLMS